MAGLIRRVVGIALAAAWLAATGAALRAQAVIPSQTGIQLRTGDRVVFLGDSFFERESRLGVIEAALTAAHSEQALTFRNLGWSGDSVRGDARAYFGKPLDGYAELLKSIDLVKPSIVFVSYGANEAFAGEPGLDAFLSDYGTLLADLSTRTPRIVLLTPLPADRASSPLPAEALDERNRILSRYSEAIRSLAASRGLPTIDLFSAMLASMTRRQARPLFEHGMHLTADGYAVAAAHIVAHTAPTVPREEMAPRADALRPLIVRKNELFFHRWRPGNVTYLFLFRQREQGNNAVEVPRFDPLIAGKEQEIAALVRTLSGPAAGGSRR